MDGLKLSSRLHPSVISKTTLMNLSYKKSSGTIKFTVHTHQLIIIYGALSFLFNIIRTNSVPCWVIFTALIRAINSLSSPWNRSLTELLLDLRTAGLIHCRSLFLEHCSDVSVLASSCSRIVAILGKRCYLSCLATGVSRDNISLITYLKLLLKC